MKRPRKPKIYHIVHVDRLASIVRGGFLWCDAETQEQGIPGTTIGMPDIKERRTHNKLVSHPDLHVGDCVPFYFCPRSVMLYVLHMANLRELPYRGGQGPIVHLEASLHDTVNWVEKKNRRWAFTTSNAGSYYFSDYSDLSELNKINWAAVQAEDWRRCKEEKQAEFLAEKSFPWALVERVGVHSTTVQNQVLGIIASDRSNLGVKVEVLKEWYY